MPLLPSLVLRVAHTAELSPDIRAIIRELLDLTFDSDFNDDDWDHALGGLHTLAFLEERLVGHAALVQRAFLLGEVPQRVGYLEAMGIHPDCQRQGIGRAIMERINHQVAWGYDFGALSTSAAGLGLYRSCAWEVWQGPLSVMTSLGLRATPEEEDGVLVYAPAGGVDLHLSLTCEFRRGDVW
ncbi:aminoglycoside 2'-N-acetyltransferase [Deinococcus humi]|nr:aminoglycoside 2'-N-acetyltransferase [Deinococcus humi]